MFHALGVDGRTQIRIYLGDIAVALHFSESELAERRARACAEIAARGLDGLLVFRQESMFYLTGYDTFGFVYFQCLFLAADGRMTLLTRAPDLRQARHTSVIADIRIWTDGSGTDPAANKMPSTHRIGDG